MLCPSCKKKRYKRDIGKCKYCGAGTSSGSIRCCPKCSTARNECAACGVPLPTICPEPPRPGNGKILDQDKVPTRPPNKDNGEEVPEKDKVPPLPPRQPRPGNGKILDQDRVPTRPRQPLVK